MKKKFCIALAALLMAACFVGCGSNNDASESSSSSVSESSEASESSEVSESSEASESSDEEKDDAEDEDSKDEDSDKKDSSEDEDEDSEKKAEPVEIKPDDVKEKDFVGKWECAKMVSGGEVLEGSLMGIPLNVMLHFDIKEDGTGEMGSNMPAESEEEAANMKQDIKWTYADNKLTVTVEGEEDEAYIYIEGGKLVFTDEEQTDVYYFEKVDKFTEFSLDDMYSALGIDPEELEKDVDSSLESSSVSKDIETSSETD